MIVAVNLFYRQIHLFFSSRPAEKLNTAYKIALLQVFADIRVVGIVYQCLHMPEKLQFFCRFLVNIVKTFSVGTADIGKNAYGWLNNGLQSRHFVRSRDACFKNSQLVAFRHIPHRHGHPYLRIETVGRIHHFFVFTQQLKQPFFDGGFSVAAGDTDNGNIEPAAVVLYQLLQSF